MTVAKLLEIMRKLDEIPQDVIAHHPLVGQTGMQMVDDKGTITVIGPAGLHALKQQARTLPPCANPILGGAHPDVIGGVRIIFLEDGGPIAEKVLKRIQASLKAAGQVVEIFDNLRRRPPSNHIININIL